MEPKGIHGQFFPKSFQNLRPILIGAENTMTSQPFEFWKLYLDFVIMKTNR
jgi:hypothetical protein